MKSEFSFLPCNLTCEPLGVSGESENREHINFSLQNALSLISRHLSHPALTLRIPWFSVSLQELLVLQGFLMDWIFILTDGRTFVPVSGMLQCSRPLSLSVSV